MKRVVVILFLIIFFGVGNAIAQNISPMELKEARLALYEWFFHYENNDIFDADNSEIQYCKLFADSMVVVVNDYLPYGDYDFKNPTLPLYQYINIVKSNRKGFYNCYSELIDVDVVSEKLSGRILEYEFELEKVVWCIDSVDMADCHYEYPKDTLKYNVRIEYDIDLQQAKATSIQLNEPIDEFVVLHQNGTNIYTTIQQMEMDSLLFSNTNVPMINYKYNSCYFDHKMYELQCDTMKWAAFCGGSIGNGFWGTISNNLYSDMKPKSKLNYCVDLGIYRQLKLKGNNRLGIEFALAYKQTILNINNIYGDRYSSVDIDGGSYERIISVTGYEENITRFATGVPIALRYDRFMMAGMRKRIAFSSKLGVLPMYDFKQVSRATADAQYSGYYDWLWGVTIDQNDIYDYGNYSINNKYKNTAVGKFSLDAFVTLGVSYYVTRKVSIDLSAAYYGTLYNKVNYANDNRLTNDKNDWQSATCLMKSHSLHSINLILQMNYNF